MQPTQDQKPEAEVRVDTAYREEVGLRPNSVWPDILVLAACLVTLCWGIGKYGLYEPHEGHFAGVSREMVLSGDWLTPHLNGSPYLNKPPLLYWSLALSQTIFGINEWAARFPLALYGWLGALVAWAFGREVFGRASGRLAAGVLTTSAGWFLFTHQLLIDALLSSLQLAAVYGFWRATREPERRRHWLCFYGAISLALMAKGPVGLLFPGAAALGYLIVRWRWDLLRHARLWWGIPLALAPVVIWGLLVESRNPGFLHHIIVNEHINRVGDARWPRDYSGVQVGPLAYLGTAAVWCAPWTLFIVQIACKSWHWAMHRDWASLLEEGVPVLQAKAQAVRRGDAVLLLAFAALGPVVLFLPMPSRLVYYCLPAVPPFAVLAAGWWIQAGLSRVARTVAAGLLVSVGAAIFSAGFWVVPVIDEIPDLAAAPDTLRYVPYMAWSFGCGLMLSALFLWQGRPRAAGFWACVLCAVAWVFATDGFAGYQDVRSSKRLVERLDPRLGTDATWISEGSNELGVPGAIAYYLGRDEFGRARTVFVMDDDERRPQARFADGLPRQWAMKRDGLDAYWESPHPVVFVTDPMRRDWKDDEPWLPEDPGNPVFTCGFRRVYANRAAHERMEWHNKVLQLARNRRDRIEDERFPHEEKRLLHRIPDGETAAAELLSYVQERSELRTQRWTGVMRDGDLYYMLNRPGEYSASRKAIYCFVGRDYVRYLEETSETPPLKTE